MNLRPPSLTGLPSATLDVAKGVSDLLARLPAIERSIARAAQRALDTLEEIDERLAPIEEILARLGPVEVQLNDLQDSAGALAGRLDRANDTVAPLNGRIEELAANAARIEGALEHLLDRVPGLSANDARKRAERLPPNPS